ncbi:MAG: OmpA family protein [Candidatus Dadabacteria bacterium]|nr:MAG: OmpA family protein [Candidatus Dadabacteria bacterium]
MKAIYGLSAIALILAFALPSLAQQPQLPLRDIFFDQGQFILREDAKPVLGENAETLATNPDIEVEIVGYCNSDEYSSNHELGLQRAEAVRSFLMSEGINPQRIKLSAECDGKNEVGNVSPDVSEVKLHLDSRAEMKAHPQSEPGLL